MTFHTYMYHVFLFSQQLFDLILNEEIFWYWVTKIPCLS